MKHTQFYKDIKDDEKNKRIALFKEKAYGGVTLIVAAALVIWLVSVYVGVFL